jgi:transcriptional regulator with XRE-family HTH domain
MDGMSTELMGAGYVPVWSFGDRLRKAREMVNLDQTALARDLGVSRQTISNAERGEKSPRRSLVMAWAMRTRVSLLWLETGEAPSPDGDGASQWAPRGSNSQPTDVTKVLVLRPALVAA